MTFSISTDSFSPFLHSTIHYQTLKLRGFEGGPPKFKQKMTFSVLLNKKLKSSLSLQGFYLF